MANSQHILASDFKEAHDFATETLGLKRGHYHLVTSVAGVRHIRNVVDADLHLVPGWDRRPERFTIASALKWARCNVIDWASDKPQPTIEQQSSSRGEQQNEALSPDATSSSDFDLDDLQYSLSDEDAHFYLMRAVDPAILATVEAHPEVKKRRSKCKTCGKMMTPEERESGMHGHSQDLASVT